MSRLPTLLALLLAPALPSAAQAAQSEEGPWSVEVASVYTTVYGHDQHVLTVHSIDLDGSPVRDEKRAVSMDPDDGFAYRGAVRYGASPRWSWGLDFQIFVTGANAPTLSRAADGAGGAIDQVVFEIADGAFASSRPGDVLFYRPLEDNAVETWTLDLYALRTLAAGEEARLALQLGLRNGDFDNDYRAVVGIEGAGGARLDASSNYDRMMGPLVGLLGEARWGRNTFEGYLGQSLLIGTAELTGSQRLFTGPFSETPDVFAEEVFRKEQDVGIPVTEFRLDWRYRLRQRIALGLGAHASAWWDVPVPPGIAPGPGGDQVLHEDTIVLLGLLGAVEVSL